MTTARLGTVLSHLRILAAGSAPDLSDSQLVERYCTGHDEAAFATLVKRFGNMVWCVCRHVLPCEQDAEDAFQATFLILARKAGSIRKADALSGWLHGVAYRSAMKAKTQAARRRAHEKQAVPIPQPKVESEAAWRELQAMLDEELHRLPDHYRAPFVLCCLEGNSKAEAARRLGWKEGTVSSRLARARKRLQERLTRRGVSLSALLCGAALTHSAASGAVPTALVSGTLGIVRVGASQATAGLVSAEVAAIAKGVTKAMFLTKYRIATALLLGVSLLATGAGALTHQVLAAQPPAAEQGARPRSVAGAAGLAMPVAENPKPKIDLYGDPLPDGAIARLGTTRLRLGGMIHSAAPAVDGKTIVAAGFDQAVRMFETATGKEIRQFRLIPNKIDIHEPDTFRAVALSPDGKTVAAGCNQYPVIVLWNTATGEQIGLLKRPSELPKAVPIMVSPEISALAFSPDGKLLASGGANKTIRLWDVAARKELRQLPGHQLAVNALVLSSDGKQLISGSADKTIRFWEVDTGRQLRTLRPSEARRGGWDKFTGNPTPPVKGEPSPVLALAVSPDGKLFASSGEDEIVHVWDLAAGKELRVLEPTGQRYPRVPLLTSVAFSPDSKTVAAGDSLTIYLWDAATGTEQKRFTGHHGPIHFVGFVGDKQVASAAMDMTIRLWDRTTGKELHAWEGHQELIHALAVSPDGRRAVTAGRDKLARLWDLADSHEIGRLEQATGKQVEALAYAPDGKTVAGVMGRSIVFWNAATGKEVRRIDAGGPSSFCDLAFGPGGKSVVACKITENDVRLWDLGTGKELQRFTAHPANAGRKIAYSPDGTIIAALNSNHNKTSTLQLWDAADGRELRTLEEANDCQGGLAFSPDGKQLAAGAGMDTIRLWDVRAGKQIRSMRGTPNDHPVNFPIAFSPDGRMLASGSFADHTIYVFEAATGGLRCKLSGHRGMAHALAFTSDSARLISGSADTTALTWDVTGRLATPQTRQPDAAEIGQLLADLGDADAAKAFHAIGRLADAADQALPRIKEHIHSVKPTDPERVAALIRLLDSDTFSVRDKAAAELASCGEAATGLLRQALEKSPSAEVRRQVERLLSKIDGRSHSADGLREVRAVETLERIGTPGARQVLQNLTNGAPDARLTREAKAALERLGRR